MTAPATARVARALAALLLWAGGAVAAAAQELPVLELRPGMVITRSARIRPAEYRLQPAPGDAAVITIRGDGIVVDFTGSSLLGGDGAGAVRGAGVLVEGASAVELRGVRVHGFDTGVLVRDSRRVTVADGDLGRNGGAASSASGAASTPGASAATAADPLGAEGAAALREQVAGGAGIRLLRVRGAEVRGNRIADAAAGIVLEDSDSVRVWNSVIEGSAGSGITLHRTSRSEVVHNHVLRSGTRHAAAANVLLLGASSGNVVAFNSVADGANGILLVRGVPDGGADGPANNMVFANDASGNAGAALGGGGARNTWIGNTATGSRWGWRGAGSRDVRVLGNDFGWNGTGAAVDAGENVVIGANRFVHDSVAISVGGVRRESGTAESGGRGIRIDTNNLYGSRVGVRVEGTAGLAVMRNQLVSIDTAWVLRDTVAVSFVANDTTGIRDARGDDWPPLPAHRSLDPIIILPRPLPGGLPLRRREGAGAADAPRDVRAAADVAHGDPAAADARRGDTAAGAAGAAAVLSARGARSRRSARPS